MEAQNLARMTQAQTPLLGGSNPELHASDFSGSTPKHSSFRTPNALTPAHPSSSAQTPIRDVLSLNRDGYETEENRRRLDQGFAALSKPEREYRIRLPEIQKDEEAEGDRMEEDAADVENRLREAEQKKAEHRERLKSQVLKKDLPRPLAIVENYLEGTELDEAEQLVRDEMLVLLSHDAMHYPITGSRVAVPPKIGDYIEYSDLELSDARKLIAEEHEAALQQTKIDPEQWEAIWQETYADLRYLPTKRASGRFSRATKAEQISSLKADFDAIHKHMKKVTAKAGKLEQRAKVYTGGYQKKSGQILQDIDVTTQRVLQKLQDLETFKVLQNLESLALSSRVGRLQEEVDGLTEQEADLQRRYAQLKA